MKPAIFLLTCANDKEANKISRLLLEKQLIVCAKKSNVESSFWWKDNIEQAEEILLIMESQEENFDIIQKEVRKIHSYDTFVLECLPISKTSKGVEEWLKENLKK